MFVHSRLSPTLVRVLFSFEMNPSGTFFYSFECGEESHVPASCRDVRNWQKRESDDGSTAEWMKVFFQLLSHVFS